MPSNQNLAMRLTEHNNSEFTQNLCGSAGKKARFRTAADAHSHCRKSVHPGNHYEV
jgi:hypothetical protein